MANTDVDINIYPLPNPKEISLDASKLHDIFPELGVKQLARIGDESEWDDHALYADMSENGYQDYRGGKPAFRAKDKAPFDGNQRLSTVARLAKEKPEMFGKLKVKCLEYPETTTDAQVAELIARGAATTNPFTVWDYHYQVMNLVKNRPGISQLDVVKTMGVRNVRHHFPLALRDEVLVKTANGLIIKPGLTAQQVFEGGKGGQKQGPVQVGIALAKAHPKPIEMYFNGRNDPEHSITYRQLIDANTAWRGERRKDEKTGEILFEGGDIVVNPEWSSPVASWDFLMAQTNQDGTPKSKLVKLLAPILAHGKDKQNGRTLGKGKMSAKETEAQIGRVSENPFAVITLKNNLSEVGYVGDEFDRLYMKLNGLIGRFVTQDPEAKAVVAQIFSLAARESVKTVDAAKQQAVSTIAS